MKLLVDSSIWIDHFRSGDPILGEYLRQDWVVMHPMVIGEVSLGSLQQRHNTLRSLGELSPMPIASQEEMLEAVELQALWGAGVGWIDVHLLASCLLAQDVRLWTRDKRLDQLAERLGLKHHPLH